MSSEAYDLYVCPACQKLWVQIQTPMSPMIREKSGGGWISTETRFTWRECDSCRRKMVEEST